jgi:hypothetical protein
LNIIEIDEYWAGDIGPLGSAHFVSSETDPATEAVQLLHDAVKEVTGVAIEPAPKPRIGFLP